MKPSADASPLPPESFSIAVTSLTVLSDIGLLFNEKIFS